MQASYRDRISDGLVGFFIAMGLWWITSNFVELGQNNELLVVIIFIICIYMYMAWMTYKVMFDTHSIYKIYYMNLFKIRNRKILWENIDKITDAKSFTDGEEGIKIYSQNEITYIFLKERDKFLHQLLRAAKERGILVEGIFLL